VLNGRTDEIELTRAAFEKSRKFTIFANRNISMQKIIAEIHQTHH